MMLLVPKGRIANLVTPTLPSSSLESRSLELIFICFRSNIRGPKSNPNFPVRSLEMEPLTLNLRARAVSTIPDARALI